MSDEVKIPQRVSQSYRELGAEDPPRALDEAILAAARRGRQRWYAPLATAAVLVLAVAVTLDMQRERPGVESPVTQVPPRADQPAKKISPANAEAELKLRSATELKRKPDDFPGSPLTSIRMCPDSIPIKVLLLVMRTTTVLSNLRLSESRCTTTAGRTLEPEPSPNGNRKKTTSPR